MVLPNAALDREQFEGFRSGNYTGTIGNLCMAFDGSWDLRRIRPHFFPRGSSVVFARRTDDPRPMDDRTIVWKGKLGNTNCDWAEAQSRLERTPGRLMRVESTAASTLGERFSQGATFNPRVAFLVKERPPGPLGLPAGRVAVESSRSVNEKKPYKDLPSLEGVIETEFMRPVYSGENLLPYRVVAPLQAIIPCSTSALLNEREIDQYPGLSSWWSKAEDLWEKHKAAATKLTLFEQLDYHAKMSKQLPVATSRVIYNASGMHLVAAKVRNHRAIISKSLYWAAFREENEADYLCAILNSAATSDTSPALHVVREGRTPRRQTPLAVADPRLRSGRSHATGVGHAVQGGDRNRQRRGGRRRSSLCGDAAEDQAGDRSVRGRKADF